MKKTLFCVLLLGGAVAPSFAGQGPTDCKLYLNDHWRNCCPLTGLCQDTSCSAFGLKSSAKSECAAAGNKCDSVYCDWVVANCSEVLGKAQCFGTVKCKNGGTSCCADGGSCNDFGELCLGSGNSFNFKICDGVPKTGPSPGPHPIRLPSPSPNVPPPSQSCSFYMDINFAGADLVVLSADTAAECCGLCLATARCAAWTWVSSTYADPSYHKLCFLKEVVPEGSYGRGLVSGANPNAPPIPPPSQSCSFFMNTNFAGSDLATLGTGTAAECCGRCLATSRCMAWTWVSYTFIDPNAHGLCFLKDAVPQGSEEPGLVSGVNPNAPPIPSPSKSCSFYMDTDFTGADLLTVRTSTAAECCGRCLGTSGCVAWTWVSSNYADSSYNQLCFLKNAIPRGTYGPGLVSGAIPNAPNAPPPTEVCSFYMDTNFDGADLEYGMADNAAVCCDRCSKRSGCVAWTWVSDSFYNEGFRRLCFLKDAVLNVYYGPDLVSGVIPKGVISLSQAAPPRREAHQTQPTSNAGVPFFVAVCFVAAVVFLAAGYWHLSNNKKSAAENSPPEL